MEIKRPFLLGVIILIGLIAVLVVAFLLIRSDIKDTTTIADLEQKYSFVPSMGSSPSAEQFFYNNSGIATSYYELVTVSGNLTANYLYGDGSFLTGVNGSGDIHSVNTLGNYLYGGSTSGDVNIYLNGTELNATIDDRDTDTQRSNSDILGVINNSGVTVNCDN